MVGLSGLSADQINIIAATGYMVLVFLLSRYVMHVSVVMLRERWHGVNGPELPMTCMLIISSANILTLPLTPLWWTEVSAISVLTAEAGPPAAFTVKVIYEVAKSLAMALYFMEEFKFGCSRGDWP